jgi:hypothetical protein
MDIQQIRRIALSMGIRTKGIEKADLVRAIQRAEGNFDCYGTAVDEECDQESCLWKEDCFFESVSSDTRILKGDSVIPAKE